MASRFRYLDESGDEVEVQDLDALRERVRQGDVEPDTLLFDAESGEWAPAEVHSAYRKLDVVDLEPLTEPPDAEEEAPADEEMDFHIPGFDATLAQEPEQESTEEALKKLLRERERDPVDRPDLVMEGGLVLDDRPSSRSGSGPGTGSDAETPAEDRTASRDREAEATPRALHPADRGGSRPSGSGVAGAPSAASPPRAAPAPGASRRRTPWRAIISGGIVAVVLASVGYMLTGRTPTAAVGGDVAPVAEEMEPVEDAPAPWAVAEGGALVDMIQGVDSLRRVYEVDRVPAIWLDGRYIADADEYPGVKAYWERYEEFVDAVQEQDTALFRRGFVSRLEEQDLSGPIISIRLARALETFEASQPARDTVYGRMESLATASLDLHELLVARTDDIEYDPITESRASRQPILEAWSDDPYLRDSIWALLDRITQQLAYLEGEDADSRSDLTERLFQELRRRSGG